MKQITLPAFVGDTVFCNVDNHKEPYLDECYVRDITIEKDCPHDGEAEPLFTVICDTPTKKDFNRFWASDFGKEVFTIKQYYENH